MKIGQKVFHRSSGRNFKGTVMHKYLAGKRLLIKWEDGNTCEHESLYILKVEK
jgi:hypothetical protein